MYSSSSSSTRSSSSSSSSSSSCCSSSSSLRELCFANECQSLLLACMRVKGRFGSLLGLRESGGGVV